MIILVDGWINSVDVVFNKNGVFVNRKDRN